MNIKFKKIPFSIWVFILVLFLFPFSFYFLYYFPLQSHISHNIVDMVWCIYIIPPIAIAYYYDIKGAISSSIILQTIHFIFEYYIHKDIFSLDVILSMLIQLILSITVSYTVGFMARNLKHKNLELEKAYKSIEKMAYFDPLTGLANRCMFKKYLENELLSHRQNGKQCSLLFLDLDGFKQVNDEFGHDAGDMVLIEVVKRFKTCINEADMLARLAGDEFIILLPESTQSGHVKVAERILQVTQLPFEIQNNKVKLTVSIGITIYADKNDTTAETLIKQADMAMYSGKRLGKNNFQLYYPKNTLIKEG
ncbi:MAG: GGDEF domain-containing protein [Thermotaleaceae bacterium]